MITKAILLFFACTIMHALHAQPVQQPEGGGSYDMHAEIKDDVSPEQRALIIKNLQRSEKELQQKGLLPATYAKPMATMFEWPLRQAPGFYDNGYYGISNYIDGNPSVPNLILDYNCGTRSYDLSSGYNHRGTDIFTWPFGWQKMYLNAVHIVAAAPGTILYKEDGNPDQNCAFCPGACSWNAVYIMHADGSVAWYGHMKLNSLTPKAVGQTVAAGEYLGVVGSSGNSTAPHLHFEVWTNNSYTQLVDPWAGPCNAFNGNTTWWASQQPYYVPTLNKVMTHFPPPATGNCPATESYNSKVNFVNGETVYLASYYRDQLPGQQSIHTVYRPDGSVFANWSQNFTVYYSASWWYYSIVLPLAAPTGMWRYSIAYNGRPPITSYFAVNTTGYTFIGNGNWNEDVNWVNQTRPPATLPPGHHIVINPIEGGECIVNVPQTISAGGKITVVANKKLVTHGNLVIQ